MRFIRVILLVSIIFAAEGGDYAVFKSKYSDSFVFRALTDSFVHGLIGFLSALLFFSNNVNTSLEAYLFNTLFCTCISLFIDIDHFIVARSLHLKDLINLKQRGIFHCTTFWLAITTVLTIYSHITQKLNIYLLTYMLFLGFTSHHIRDANRRGLWLYPFGHTIPLQKSLYIFLICIIPTIFAIIFNCTKPMFKHTVVQYTNIV